MWEKTDRQSFFFAGCHGEGYWWSEEGRSLVYETKTLWVLREGGGGEGEGERRGGGEREGEGREGEGGREREAILIRDTHVHEERLGNIFRGP